MIGSIRLNERFKRLLTTIDTIEIIFTIRIQPASGIEKRFIFATYENSTVLLSTYFFHRTANIEEITQNIWNKFKYIKERIQSYERHGFGLVINKGRINCKGLRKNEFKSEWPST